MSQAWDMAGSLYEYRGIGAGEMPRGLKRGQLGYFNPNDIRGRSESRFGRHRGAW